MPQAQDEAGNIWETDAQGNAIRLVRAAGGGGNVYQDPYKAAAEGRANEDQAIQRQGAGIASQNAAIAQAEEDRKRRTYDATHLPDGTPKPAPASAEDQAKINARNGNLDSIVGQINRVQQLYNQDVAPEVLRNGFGILDNVGPSAGRFNSAGQGLADQGLAAFRVPGVGSQSDMEARQFAMANTPQAGDWDAQIEEKLRTIRARVDANRKAQGLPPAEWTGIASQDAKIAAAAGGGGFGGITPGGGSVGPMTPAGGESFSTQADISAAQALQQAYNSGADVPAMLGIARQFGFNPAQQDVAGWQTAIDYRDGTGQYKGKRRGLAEVTTPQSGRRNLAEQALGNFAATPLGAGALSAADFGTFGLTDEIAGGINSALGKGNYEDLRDYANFGKNASASLNPNAVAIGSVVGGIAGGAGLEAAAGRALTRLPAGSLMRARSILANPLAGAATEGALFGGAYGAGSNNNDRLSGAMQGAVVGGGGGALGAGATRAASGMLGGVRDEAVQRLANAGVTLSPGQILGNSGIFGRAIKKLEDTAESIPLVGSAIRTRREEGFRDFNRAALNEALTPIQATVNNVAEQGVEQARDAVQQGYRRALGGVRVPADRVFADNITNAVNAGRVPGNYTDDFERIVRDEVGPALSGGGTHLEGQAIQDGLRMTRGYGRQYGRLATEGAGGVPQPSARPVAGAFNDMAQSIEDLLGRQAPDVMPAYNAANQAYRGVGVVRDAVNAAKVGTQSGQGGVFTPAQLSQAARANAKKFGGTQGTTEQPFFQLTRDAQDILPSQVPNSGTADRAMAALTLSAPAVGAGYAANEGLIDPETAAAVAALTGLYSRPGQRLSQAVLSRRPDALRRAAEILGANSGTAGRLSAPLGLSLLAAGSN